MSLQEQFHRIKRDFVEALNGARSLSDLDSLEIRFLGRKGALAELMRQMASATTEERPMLGRAANETKVSMENALTEKRKSLQQQENEKRLSSETEDVTESGIRPLSGHLHPVTQTIQEITSIFERAGFARMRYPEVEWDWYTFEALNMPKDHPARDEQETFLIDTLAHKKYGKMILSTQATSGTARCLEEGKPPIRAFNIVKTYRRESNATHTPMFHQIDVAVVDRGISVAHLRGVLDYFAKSFFGPGRRTRLRPHHFRFTEPSFEIDVSCGVCGGSGWTRASRNAPACRTGRDQGSSEKCRVCKRGWLELGGSGMLHPQVLKTAGIDPRVYSGLAFGWGIERVLMMKEGLALDDMRTLYQNDLRFLQQF